MKLWKKKHNLDEEIEKFTVGNDYILDEKIVKYDCQASIAHAKMLNKINILTDDELDKIVKELNNILDKSQEGDFKIDLSQEDVHTAIENYLVDKLGDLGKKIHTARSRNDQVLVALRLYYQNELSEVKKGILLFQKSLHSFIKNFGEIVIPGFTHTRKAMPSSISMWSKSFIDSMDDNLKLIDTCFELLDQCPLGTGAGYGVPLKIDCKITAELLNFSKIQENPIYAQNSRGKFESSILHSLSQISYDLNKMSSDLIFFTYSGLGHFSLPDEFCTGSSIMPQKKNPDVLELVRSKHHSILAAEFQVKGMLSNLISGYHRDMQLLKEPMIKSFNEIKNCLNIMSLVIGGLEVNKARSKELMTDELYATERVYELVKNGVSFRDAYKKIGKEF